LIGSGGFRNLPLLMVLVFMFMGEAWNPEKVCYPGCPNYCSRLKYQVCMEVGTALRLTLKCKLIVLEEGQ